MGANKNENLKPGNITPASGQYPVIGPRGGKTGDEVTSVKGNPLPPTPKAGQSYGKPDLTKNGSGTGAKGK
ncbi:hypothetical protein BayCH28_22265 [Mycolicibacterium sp. CH28]|uniref:hypothetical protein n=1 Tax=Mycolicibacterium sp. CH28 TaxID=2512237 RepID=UPI001081069A|nr:hypothetical protein [Mycolicibacterium sp. CH28]TGD85129.1 hypothetical protein BayCH28_22265 [Mycolicibacterium sp. CH28]